MAPEVSCLDNVLNLAGLGHIESQIKSQSTAIWKIVTIVREENPEPFIFSDSAVPCTTWQLDFPNNSFRIPPETISVEKTIHRQIS